MLEPHGLCLRKPALGDQPGCLGIHRENPTGLLGPSVRSSEQQASFEPLQRALFPGEREQSAAAALWCVKLLLIYSLHHTEGLWR